MPEDFDKGECEQCGKNPAVGPHECPFRSKIEAGKLVLCNCCEACAGVCGHNIESV